MSDILIDLGLDLSEVNSDIKRAVGTIKQEFAKVKPKIDIDGKVAQSSVNQLTTSFQKMNKEANLTTNQMKQAMAQMILSGQQGSKAYQALEKELKDSTAQAKLLDKAMEQVNDGIADTKTKTQGSGLRDFGEQLKSGLFMGGGIGIAMAGIQKLQQGFTDTIKLGLEFESSLADLSAITGVTGKDLDNFGESAKRLSSQFGGSATDQISTFKGILSRLGPDIANTPEALNSMTDSINTMAKAAGLDATTSMMALTTAALQYGVDLSDPIGASEEMAKMMNVMAAGSKEGASEIPRIAEALEVSGAMAKSANVSFEELNAGIQVLATRGKQGAEAGTALRNILTILGKGRFLPKQTLEELQAAGVSTDTLSDKSLTLAERLKSLGPIMQDDALIAKLFGAENLVAGKALLEQTTLLENFTTKMTGTNTATEQAAINMSTFSERMSRIGATIKNSLISAFDTFKPAINAVLTVFEKLFQNLEPLSPLLMGMAAAFAAATAAAIAKTLALSTLGVGLKAFALALATNPITIWAVAIGAAVGGLIALADALSVTAEERKEEAEAMMESNKLAIQQNQTRQKELTSTRGLITEYETLIEKKNKTSEETQRLNDIQEQLNETYPEAIELGEDHAKSLEGVKEAAGLAGANMSALDKETITLIEDFESLSKKTNKTKEEKDKYAKTLKTLKDKYPEFIEGNDNYATSLESIKKQSGYAIQGLSDLQGEMLGLLANQRAIQKDIAYANRDIVKDNAIKELTNMFGGYTAASNIFEKEYAKLVKVSTPEALEKLRKSGIETFEALGEGGKDAIRNWRLLIEEQRKIITLNERITKTGGGGTEPKEGDLSADGTMVFKGGQWVPLKIETGGGADKSPARTALEKLQEELKKLETQAQTMDIGSKQWQEAKVKADELRKKIKEIEDKLKAFQNTKVILPIELSDITPAKYAELVDKIGTKPIPITVVPAITDAMIAEIQSKIDGLIAYEAQLRAVGDNTYADQISKQIEWLKQSISGLEAEGIFEELFAGLDFGELFGDLTGNIITELFDSETEALREQTETIKSEYNEQSDALRAKLSAQELSYDDYRKQMQDADEEFIKKQKETEESVRDTWDNIYQIAIDSMLNMMNSQIPAIVALIFGQATAQNPILGPILAAGLTATFLGLTAIAKSAMGAEEGLVGLNSSYNTKPKGKDSIPFLLAPMESVINAKGTMANGNAEFFNWVNRTGGSIHDYMGGTMVNELKGIRQEMRNTRLIETNHNNSIVIEDNRAVRVKTMKWAGR